MTKPNQLTPAIALAPAKKGEKVSVRLPNGQVKRLTANNDIISSNVLVIGDRVLSNDVSRSQLSRTTELFQSKTTVRSGESCQLVAASVVRGYIRVVDFDEHPNLVGQPDGVRIASTLAITGWDWSENSGVCAVRTDGSGQYGSAEECLAANRRNSPDFVKQGNENQDPIYTYYHDRNGELVVNRVREIEPDATIRIVERIVHLNIPENDFARQNNVPADDFTYMVRKIPSGVNRWVQYKINDGSVTEVVDGAEIPLNISEFTKTKSNFFITWTRTKDISFSDLPNYSEFKLITDITRSSNYQSGATGTQIGFNEPSDRFSFLRDAAIEYSPLGYLESYFLKLHDPDLPPVKMFDVLLGVYQKVYAVIIEDRAYGIRKIGKLYQPELPLEERTWQQIELVEWAIAGEELEERERDFLNYDDAAINSPIREKLTKHPLFHLFGYFEDPQQENACFDNSIYELNHPRHRFIEVSYQNKGKIVEYKIPGRVVRTFD